LRYAYVAGAMANGIGSVDIVAAMSRAGMLGFFGAAGLGLERVEAAIDRLRADLGTVPSSPFGFNLIHSPNEPDLEAAVVACTCGAASISSRRRRISISRCRSFAIGCTPFTSTPQVASLRPEPHHRQGVAR